MKRRWRLWVGILLLSIFSVAALLVGSPDTLGWLRGWPSLDDPAPAFADPDEETWPRFVLDGEKGWVVKEQAPGKVEWFKPLAGHLGRVRPPHLVFDAERVYVTHDDGVTALNAKNGKVLWHSPGPEDRLCLSGDLLFAAQCGESKFSEAHGHWLFGRSVQTGKVKFKVALKKPSDPNEIRQLADLFLVQEAEEPGGAGNGFLIDRQGNVQHRFDRQVIDGVKLDGDHVFLTSKDVICRSRTDQERWAVSFGRPEWIAGGGLLLLPDGDLLAFLNGCINDSGVQVMRIHPQSGEQVWQAACGRLGVPHSAYWHQAKVEICKEKYLKVMSKGSQGSFVELVDLRSGQQLSRKEFGGPAKRHWLLVWLFGK